MKISSENQLGDLFTKIALHPVIIIKVDKDKRWVLRLRCMTSTGSSKVDGENAEAGINMILALLCLVYLHLHMK